MAKGSRGNRISSHAAFSFPTIPPYKTGGSSFSGAFCGTTTYQWSICGVIYCNFTTEIYNFWLYIGKALHTWIRAFFQLQSTLAFLMELFCLWFISAYGIQYYKFCWGFSGSSWTFSMFGGWECRGCNNFSSFSSQHCDETTDGINVNSMGCLVGWFYWMLGNTL